MSFVAFLVSITIISYVLLSSFLFEDKRFNVSTGEENPSVAVPRLAGNDPTEIEPLQAEDSTANILGSARELSMVGTGTTCDPRTGNM